MRQMSTLFFIFLENFVICNTEIKNQHPALSQSVDFCDLRQDFVRHKVQFIRCNQLEINAIPDPLHRQRVARSVKVAVEATADIVPLQ
jgi:hypothetical protein